MALDALGQELYDWGVDEAEEDIELFNPTGNMPSNEKNRVPSAARRASDGGLT